MPDARLRHHGNRDGANDALNHVGVGHTGHAALRTNIGGYALKRHDGDGTSIFGDLGLFGGDDVHNDAALEHVGKPALHERGAGYWGISLFSHAPIFSRSVHVRSLCDGISADARASLCLHDTNRHIS